MSKLKIKLEDMKEGVVYSDGNNKYILNKCIDCGKVRAVAMTHGEPRHIRCALCAGKLRKGIPLTEEHKKNVSIATKKAMQRPEVKAKITGIKKRGHACTDKTKSKISAALKGRKFTKETIEKMKKANAGRVCTEETREKLRKTSSGRKASPETRKKISEGAKRNHKGMSGKHHSKETIEKIKLGNLGRKMTPEQIENSTKNHKGMSGLHQPESQKIKMREKWADPVWKVKAVKARLKGLAVRPTRAEGKLDKFLQTYFPNTWVYNGDGSQDVFIGGKIPDFINIKGDKKVIEMFSFHHCPGLYKYVKAPALRDNRIGFLKQYGYDCLIVWQPELKDVDKLVDKIKRFTNTKELVCV